MYISGYVMNSKFCVMNLQVVETIMPGSNAFLPLYTYNPLGAFQLLYGEEASEGISLDIVQPIY
jgi:hypothetical protein